jgi:hypothetical protein
LIGSVFSRPYENAAQEVEDFKPPVHQKPPQQTEKIIEILKKTFLTKNLSQYEIKTIADAMYHKKFEKDEKIINYGDIGTEYYILEKGVVEVIVY